MHNREATPKERASNQKPDWRQNLKAHISQSTSKQLAAKDTNSLWGMKKQCFSYDFGQCYSYHFHLDSNYYYDYYKLLQVPMITCQCYCNYNYPCRYMVQQNRILSDYPTGIWVQESRCQRLGV